MIFVTFEGIDGCGKTTQIKILEKYLKERNYEVVSLREPGGTAFSEVVREILLSNKTDVNPVSELFLFEAARSDLTEKVILPALKSGKIVLCDRFFDSTTAYQAYGRGLDLVTVSGLNRFATGDVAPDLTFYLDISLETSAARTGDKVKDRMESSGREFFERVVAGFLKIAREEERVVRLDGERAPEDLAKEIVEIIENKISSVKKIRR